MSGWLSNGLSLSTLPLSGNERFVADTNVSSGGLPQTEAITASQAGMYFAGGASLPWVAGRFYGNPIGNTPTGVLTVTGTIYAYPLWIPQTTIKTVNLGVQLGQTGGNAHVGLYFDNGAGYPGSLLVDFGAVGALTSTATVTLTASTPQPVNSGMYWVTSVFTATSTFPNVYGVANTYTPATSYQMGFDTAAHALATSGEAVSGIAIASATSVYGTLPATFPTGATLSLNAVTPMAIFGV
jgi:hypothetical protein